ncbi:hypothetical protein NM688_g8474 [Phlebia brevispora]|uniref:Uncharacterized protein n=1 Tax=Phlebia brevispora TaxID=194682 RepID=A0ACC1RS79_9APHY|nr:hypothetical protein NM688_g8474 [Phlebia brevispora]
MDTLISYDVLVIPSDDSRTPHLASLMTSPLEITDESSSRMAEVYRAKRMPHPEILMDHIEKGIGPRAWRFQNLEALDGMNRGFDEPYIIFFPAVSVDGLPFPVNRYIKHIQGELFDENKAWRGNIVIAKYSNPQYETTKSISMADFPIIKNYLSNHGCRQGRSGI